MLLALARCCLMHLVLSCKLKSSTVAKRRFFFHLLSVEILRRQFRLWKVLDSRAFWFRKQILIDLMFDFVWFRIWPIESFSLKDARGYLIVRQHTAHSALVPELTSPERLECSDPLSPQFSDCPDRTAPGWSRNYLNQEIGNHLWSVSRSLEVLCYFCTPKPTQIK